ncbi:DNA-directed RNA polymerase subunit N (RpoN/RPB10) [Bacillus mesophilus]|uniref:YhfH family protein n=1 Tax=Bacillus mesophilus TaxID=1808955 RepID=A0A6M0Q6H4_9BACI|nr:protein YhfH [Bacillus mesophilus]MBM7659859.1 DNA-directed RNA polymerase subunit N (RpoN/RPB10) [Bacillus mesophilus]NEY70718.1 YhfH family protein [Bacillus mesophilus]
MLIKSTEFFRNLPPKQCMECGKEIDEQHECYMNHCDNCNKIGD